MAQTVQSKFSPGLQVNELPPLADKYVPKELEQIVTSAEAVVIKADVTTTVIVLMELQPEVVPVRE